MLILAIDSCGASCAVCVWRDGKILTQATERLGRGQDARLMPMIVAAVEQAGITFSDIDKIAVTRGPGSFTGVRVGLAAARGIGLAAGKPVIGIDRFAIYHALHPGSDVLAVIESKRVELFCRFFPANGEAHEAGMLTEKQIDDFIAAHPGTIIVGDRTTPDDDVIAMCASLAAKADIADAAYAPRPLYLRAPDVTLPDGTPASAIVR